MTKLVTQKARQSTIFTMSNTPIPPKVKAALDHVRAKFPKVELVVFTREGRWLFASSFFEIPQFDNRLVDVSILEEAVNSLAVLPAVFQMEDSL